MINANKRSRRPPQPERPLGFGREAYVWSLFATLGLFVAGAAVWITHGVPELISPEPATDFLIGHIVLEVSFVLEGISFLQSARQPGARATSCSAI